jgi:AraC-like DNA-binding protein
MEPSRILLLLIYAVGVLNSLFAAATLLVHPGRKDLNRLLAGLLFLYTLRLSKAIGVFFLPDLHTLYHVIWFGVLALTGPLLFCYVERLRSADTKRLVLLHLVAPALFVLALIVRPDLMQHRIVYFATVGWFLAYLAMACRRIVSLLLAQRLRTSARSWLRALLAVFVVDGLLFVVFLFQSYDVSSVEAVLFSFVIYGLVYTELRRRLIQDVHDKPLQSTAPDDQLTARLTHVMTVDHAYLDANLTLNDLARLASATPHVLSRTLNDHFGQNFNDFVNGYRVEEAQRRLREPESRQKTIAAVAHECGFNSLSVFNPAFKRLTGKTPSQYQSES